MPMDSAYASDLNSTTTGLASWYTPGRSDGFGDRLLMFDNTDSVSLELLRFRRELAVAPGFDNALRESVERLGRFRHPAFSEPRAVVYLDEHDLTLVSAHVSGQRLTELPTGKVRRGLHPAIVTWIVQEVTPALAAMHSSGPAVAHGALTADRIVFTSDGRLCVVEHALGAPLQRLGLSPRALWRELGVIALADDRGLARLDARNDVVQLGTIALSLLLARVVTLEDVEQHLPLLLDEFSTMAAASPSAFAAPLRVWLEHALQLSPAPYRSAADAQEGLKALPPASPRHFPVHEEHMQEQGSMARVEIPRPPRPPAIAPVTNRLAEPARGYEPVVPAAPDPRPLPARSSGLRSRAVWIAAVLGVVALVEGVIITRLVMHGALQAAAAPTLAIETPEPGDMVVVDGKIVGTTPLRLPVTSRTRAIRLVRTATAPVIHAAIGPRRPSASEGVAPAAIADAATHQRSGGVRISSPIELKVLEGDRVLGSTADGPIVTTAGTHQFDLINTALGYRLHQTVTVRVGVLTPLAITPPTGRISINAQPWAQVLIDDKAIGETPLANVPVSLGDHQVVFRNPQFGEHRETVTVRADAPARVSTTFQR